LQKHIPHSANASIAASYAFTHCHGCQRDAYLFCNSCGMASNLHVEPAGVRCNCGSAFRSVNCPHCKTQLSVANFHSNTSDSSVRLQAEGHNRRPPAASSSISALTTIILFVFLGGVGGLAAAFGYYVLGGIFGFVKPDSGNEMFPIFRWGVILGAATGVVVAIVRIGSRNHSQR
jgi:hypothetical protein